MRFLKSKSVLGQSLIELLIAVAVFGLIITPFLGSLLNLTTAQVRYRHRVQASQYAREGLEIAYNLVVNSQDWDDFADTYDGQTWHPSSTDPLELVEGTELIDGDKFTRGISFEKKDAEILEVSSKITWEDRGKEQEVELITSLIDLSF